jgi:hypothetical protein
LNRREQPNRGSRASLSYSPLLFFCCPGLSTWIKILPLGVLSSTRPTDEPYYTIASFNLLNYGTLTHKVFDFLPPDESPFTAVQSLLTYFGLLAFGNNFFGLRMPAVACGFLVFIGTLWCLHKAPTDDPTWRRLIVGLAAAYMLGDFFFLQSNRINDPTTLMMAAIVACMMAVVAIDARMPRSLLGSLLLGLLAGFATTFVYLYMAYVAVALGATVLFGRWRNDSGRVFLHALAFAGGGILSALMFAAFADIYFQMGPTELIARLFAGGGIRGDFIRSNIFEFIGRHADDAVLQNVTHNLFLYNPALLFIFLAAIPIFVLRLVRERRTIDFFVAACLVLRLLLSALVLLALVFLLSGSLKKTAACILVGVVLLPGVRLDSKYLFAAPTFQYRDSLIRAAPKLNGKILAGGVSYAMRLYNTSIPTMNFYSYYYYGYDKFAAYSRYLFDHKLADGAILFVPFHGATILKPTYDYVNSGGLILDEAFDIKDVEEKYNFAIYLVPSAATSQPAK